MFARVAQKTISVITHTIKSSYTFLTDYVKSLLAVANGQHRKIRLLKLMEDAKKNGTAFDTSYIDANLCVIYPHKMDQTTVTKLLRTLDQDPHGRAPYSLFKEMANGELLFSNTSISAMMQRKNLIPYLTTNKNKYFYYTQEVVQRALELFPNNDLRSRFSLFQVENMVFKIVACSVLGVSELPKQFDLSGMFRQIASIGFNKPPHFIAKLITQHATNINQNKNDYLAFINALFQQEKKSILQSLHTFHKKGETNVLVDTIVDLIKEKHHFTDTELVEHLSQLQESELESYLTHSYLQTLPFIFLATSNLIQTIYTAVVNMDAFDQIRIYGEFLMKGMTEVTVDNLNQLKLLDAFYKESLRIATEDNQISRYTKKGITVNQLQIPANTEIIINYGISQQDADIWKDPVFFNMRRFLEEKSPTLNTMFFKPFSMGTRMCPGIEMSKTVFKSFMFTLIEYTFKRNLMLNADKLLPSDHKKLKM